MASSDYKKFNREIKAFVNVRYDYKTLKEDDVFVCYYYNISGRTTPLEKWQYSEDFNDVVNRDTLPCEYVILKQDYTKLNNDFFIFNKENNECGFISQYTPNELQTYDNKNVIFEANLQEGISGITLYFRNNTIKNANIKLYKQGQITPVEREITDNTEERIFIDASDDNYTHIIVETLEWTNPNEKIWLLKADLGLTLIYKNDDIIEMTITEQVDKLVEDTPNNEFSLTIGDYNKLYDPLNQHGLIKYLKQNTSTFVPYIGIVNEDGNTEYTKMGTFYYNNISYNEKEVTITSYNLINKLKTLELKNIDNSLHDIHGEIQVGNKLRTFLNKNYDFNYNVNVTDIEVLSLNELNTKTLLETLQKMIMYYGIMYANREDTLIIRNVDKTITNKISKKELIKDIKYEDIKNGKSYYSEGTYVNGSVTGSATNQDQLIIDIDLTSNKQYLVINDTPERVYNLKTSDLSYTGATNIKVSGGTNLFWNLLFLEIEGEKGNQVHISTSKSTKTSPVIKNKPKILVGENKETNINIDSTYLQTYNDSFIFLDKLYSYKLNLEYNGDPTIQAGDYIKVESNYGMVPIFVQKHTLKYNGGLNGTIEGVE